MLSKRTTVEARDHFADLINNAYYGDSPTIIYRREEALGIVISIREYNSLLERCGEMKKLKELKREI
jgi:PHD/YefM family antitoxin component YafN of YafNO toxin-antitoxin module